MPFAQVENNQTTKHKLNGKFVEFMWHIVSIPVSIHNSLLRNPEILKEIYEVVKKSARSWVRGTYYSRCRPIISLSPSNQAAKWMAAAVWEHNHMHGCNIQNTVVWIPVRSKNCTWNWSWLALSFLNMRQKDLYRRGYRGQTNGTQDDLFSFHDWQECPRARYTFGMWMCCILWTKTF